MRGDEEVCNAELHRNIQLLACAVLERAIMDAKEAFGPNSKARPARQVEAAQARIFLTATEGKWAKARITWCDRAGIDPDAFLEHALKVLP